MCTLHRDFAAESGDQDGHLRMQIDFWIAWNYRGPESFEQVRADMFAAIADDPLMTEWAAWPAVAAKGAWLRKRQAVAA